VDSIHFLKYLILSNKNDLDESTFCYALFERSFFDSKRLDDLINQIKHIKKYDGIDQDIKEIITWIITCVDQCFISNHDQKDLYVIHNYNFSIENKWISYWKPLLLSFTKNIS